jgi:hypothetical protein
MSGSARSATAAARVERCATSSRRVLVETHGTTGARSHLSRLTPAPVLRGRQAAERATTSNSPGCRVPP